MNKLADITGRCLLLSSWTPFRWIVWNNFQYQCRIEAKRDCSVFNREKWILQLILLIAISTLTSRLLDKNDTWIISFFPQCFYIPECRMNRTELQAEVHRVKNSLDTYLGNTSSCFTDLTRHPRDVILSRKYNLSRTLFALMWPGLMLGGGALLVGLVKLTQYLAQLSSAICSKTTEGKLASRYTRGNLYKLMRKSSVQSPTWKN